MLNIIVNILVGGDLCGLCKVTCSLDCSMSLFDILKVFKKNCLESLDCWVKADVTNSNTTILWTPISKWYVVRCGSKNGQEKKSMFHTDWTSLYISNLLTILGLETNMIGRTTVSGKPVDELVVFEKKPVAVRDYRRITDHLKGIYVWNIPQMNNAKPGDVNI